MHSNCGVYKFEVYIYMTNTLDTYYNSSSGSTRIDHDA